MTDTVLVVDDEPHILDLYADWLEPEYDVRTAEGGEAALEEVDESVDVILLDRRMPDLSGDEVLAEIRDQEYGCWVVMVTAVDPAVDVVDLQFDDYLVKPVDRDDLVGAVEAMLERADRRAEVADAHDEALRRYFETLAKLGMLEATHSRRELADSEEYGRLERNHLEAKERLAGAAEEVRSGGDFEDLFVELPTEEPTREE